MAYSDLKTHVRDVTHRSDLTNDLMDTWSAAVTARVNDELETGTMFGELEQTPTVNGFAVGELVGSRLLLGMRVIEVTYEGDNGPVSLQATDWKTFRNWSREDGDPRFYTQLGQQVWISPFVSQTYKLLCRLDVAPLNDDAGTNVALNLHPNIYYYGMLQQAYEYLRDFEAADRYKLLYDQEFQRANDVNKRRYSEQSPQMAGAWAWH